MKVLVLPDELYGYLQHVVKSYSGAGIDPTEGQLIFELWTRVNQAQDVDLSSLGKVKLDKMGPGGVSLTIEPETPETTEVPMKGPGPNEALD
jgi:hypothetical protein